MYKAICIGVGGFIGAVLRYLISGYIQNLSNSISFPYGTLGVNILGCLMIGLFSHIIERIGIGIEFRLLIIIGLLGSFTTYSTFANETMNLLENKRILIALININAHILLGLSAVFIGQMIASLLWR